MINFKKENKIIPIMESAVATQYNSSVSRSQSPAVLLLTCSSYASSFDDETKKNKFVIILCNNDLERSWVYKIV